MASFNLQWRSSTKKDFRKLPLREVQRVLAEVELLAENPFPHGSEKLAGTEHTHRIRVGDYRVIYEVFAGSKIVEVQRVRHRKDVYRK
jgi:mRNA interferase RelE/StbE